MRDLVIGDLHFGIKTNSINWLEAQLKFFDEQIFKVIEEKHPDRIIFLGDLMDIRYSTNHQIGIEVKKLMRKLGDIYKNPIIFVAGNHDYYSPLEEFSEYNIYELMFGSEWYLRYPQFKFINKEPYLSDDGSLFLPWYYTENPDHFDDILYQYKMKTEVKVIYCHTDLSIWPGPRITALKGIPVYSGHIHFRIFDETCNLYNLGAALALTFNDVNQDRYIYIIEDYKIKEEIRNNTTFEFKSFVNDEIFTLTNEITNNSYVKLYISTSYINTPNYIERVKELKTSYNYQSMNTREIESEDDIKVSYVSEGFNTNIKQYIKNNIPEYLNNKYEFITTKLEDK